MSLVWSARFEEGVKPSPSWVEWGGSPNIYGAVQELKKAIQAE